MASGLEKAIRLRKPGEMVVSVSEILDNLDDKLTSEEKQKLLVAVMSQRKEQVRPGDLITADLLNQVLADVADLQLRVVKIEAGWQPDTETVKILEPNPSSTLRIGDPLVIVGVNFGSAPRVMLEEALITGFELGSNERMLIIKSIPAIQNIPEKGRAVLLTVTNPRKGSDSTTFTLAQPELTMPTGTLQVWRNGTVSDAKLVAGKSYTFPYRIRAVATLDETYNLGAAIDAGWSAVAVDKPDMTGKVITSIPIPKGTVIVDGTTVDLGVRVTIPMGIASGSIGRMHLTVTSQKNSALTRTSSDTELVVDGPPPGASAIAIAPNSVTSPGSIEPVTGQAPVIKVPATGQPADEVDVTFLATVPANGKYSIKTPLTFEGNPAGWSANVVGASAGLSWTVPDETFVVTIKAQTGATAAKLKLRIVSDASAAVFGELEQNVKPKWTT
ncbi:MAG TPA: hypothetical protein VI078_14960 [bacterium]